MRCRRPALSTLFPFPAVSSGVDIRNQIRPEFTDKTLNGPIGCSTIITKNCQIYFYENFVCKLCQKDFMEFLDRTCEDKSFLSENFS
jgi:hypothetical protein